jgi:uncharacterized protein with HEPN domain
MSSKRRDKDFLGDILDAMERITAYTANLSYEEFLADPKTQDAVLRNIEIIGEAAKKVSTAVKKVQRDIPWRDMAGMRDNVIHHYFGVNYDIVWNIGQVQIPELLPKMRAILKRLED